MRGTMAAVLTAMMTVGWSMTAAGSTPESPEVKRMLARAVEFLESDAAKDDRVGAKALVGLTLVKYGAPPGHPRIVEAVAAIQEGLSGLTADAVLMDIYSTGLSAIFLVTLDPVKYQPEIQLLMDSLGKRQKPHGGWGYPDRETGDTSMTQYAVLSSWEATQAGFKVPLASIQAVATWLLKTQDPSGAFGYQGTVSTTFTPVAQSDTRHSLTAAGLGSVYISADLLGLLAREEERNDLPPALRKVAGQKTALLNPKTALDPQLFYNVQARGNAWFEKNFRIDTGDWQHYYLYALERYASFREMAEGKLQRQSRAEGAPWYNAGVEFLAKTQSANGSWVSQAGAVPDTAFACLFLLRSSRKSIEKARGFGDGLLIGGRGLPKETGRAEVRMGNVVAQPLLGPAEQLLAVLDKADHPDLAQAVDLLADLPPQQVETLFAKHADKLRRLARDQSPENRAAAVRAMGKTRDLDNVPALIYALGDADATVAEEAEEALRWISRKPTGFGPSDGMSESQRKAVAEKWKAWYLAVRPDAAMEDQ